MADSFASPKTNVYCLLASPKNSNSILTRTSSPFGDACWCCVTLPFFFYCIVIHQGLTCTPSVLSLFLSFKGETLHALVVTPLTNFRMFCCLWQEQCKCLVKGSTSAIICVNPLAWSVIMVTLASSMDGCIDMARSQKSIQPSLSSFPKRNPNATQKVLQ
jgi:hypothetical protein